MSEDCVMRRDILDPDDFEKGHFTLLGRPPRFAGRISGPTSAHPAFISSCHSEALDDPPSCDAPVSTRRLS